MIQYFVLVGAAVSLIGTLAYARDTLKGNTKPNRITWLIWGLAPLIGAAAAFADGATWAVVPTLIAGLGPVLILLCSFVNPNAYWELHWLDYLCGALSIAALVLWAVTQQPIVAIVFAIIADLLACIPTLVKAWQYPETETGIAYAMSLFSALTTFTAIKLWTVSELAFPIYLVVANILLLLAVYNRQIFPWRRIGLS